MPGWTSGHDAGPILAMTARTCLAALVLGALPTFPVSAEPRWSLELFGGAAFNFETSLDVEQEGEPDLEIDADFATRAFEDPPYYGVRLGRWTGDRAWELELVHHKLFLEDRPPEVQRFEISHGFNLVFANRAWQGERGNLWRAGLGVVAAHPETTIRGRAVSPQAGDLGGGYDLAGPALQAAVGRRLRVSERLFVPIEGKLTAAWARVPIAGGRAEVPNVALHAAVGFGGRLER